MQIAEQFLDLLKLYQDRSGTYGTRFTAPDSENNSSIPPDFFGGQTIAQALYAAGTTVSQDRTAHSLHCYFVSKGDPRSPLALNVERVRDGRGFSIRRVTVRQGSRTLLILSASFCTQRPSHSSASAMPDKKKPQVKDLPTIDLGPALSFAAYDIDPSSEAMVGSSLFWIKSSRNTAKMNSLGRVCALAYISDAIAGSPIDAINGSQPRESLDHTMWFHEDIDLNDALLFDLDHIHTGKGRTSFRGKIYNTDGKLVSSFQKEELFY